MTDEAGPKQQTAPLWTRLAAAAPKKADGAER